MLEPRGSALLVAYRISCSFTISLVTTTRTRERQPKSQVSRGTSSRPKWMRLSLCVHSCRSTAVWTTCPSSLKRRWQPGSTWVFLLPPLLFSVQVAQGRHHSTSGPNPTLKSALLKPAPALLPPPALHPSDTHTTGTVTAHQRFVKGLFLHRGLVRCTWVIEMKTGENGVSGGCQTSHSLGSHPLVPPPAAIGPSPDPLTGVQDSQGSGEFLSCQQPIGKVIKPGWSCVGTAAKATCGLSPLWARGSGLGGVGGAPGDGTHLGSMMEEQLVRLRARELSQKLCSVKPKQIRHELMVRLNLSKKQSRK